MMFAYSKRLRVSEKMHEIYDPVEHFDQDDF